MPGKQDLIRNKNYLDIINLLREKCSHASDIAKKLSLSKVAVSNMLSEMKKMGIIKESGNVETATGRKPTLISCNPNFGVIAIVITNEAEAKICFAYITGQIVHKIVYANADFFISKELVRKFELDIKAYVSSTNQNLMSIVFSISGKVNSEKGNIVYTQKIEDYKNINLKTTFEKAFKVPVRLMNDMNLSIIGEKYYSTNKTVMKNSLYLYIDSGIGSALMFDNKIFNSSSGLTGEIGLFNISAYDFSFNNSKPADFNNYVSINALYNMYLAKLNNEAYLINADKSSKETDKFIEAYLSGNEIARELVEKSGRCLGTMIYSLAELLNFNCVIISGRVKKFGDFYLDVICETVNNNSTFVDVDCRFSILDSEAVILGAIQSAVTLGIDSFFDKIKDR